MFILKDSRVRKVVAMARKPPRMSPVRGRSPEGSPPPQFAGCKWTEPPLPSALPPPPQHWMQAPHVQMPCWQPPRRDQDFENHLKVLLKVQA